MSVLSCLSLAFIMRKSLNQYTKNSFGESSCKAAIHNSVSLYDLAGAGAAHLALLQHIDAPAAGVVP